MRNEYYVAVGRARTRGNPDDEAAVEEQDLQDDQGDHDPVLMGAWEQAASIVPLLLHLAAVSYFT